MMSQFRSSIMSLQPNEMQLVYDHLKSKYISIHEIENNIKLSADPEQYFLSNTRFQMISSQRRSNKPWASFWNGKDAANQKLINAVTEGNKIEV